MDPKQKVSGLLRKSRSAAQKSAVTTKEKSSTKADFQFEIGSALNLLLKTTKGSLKELLRSMMPGSLSAQLQQAIDYARGESDLIQSLIETKIDFYAAGFSIEIKPPNKQNKAAMEERIDEAIASHELSKIAEELVFDISATDNAILHWKVDGGKIDYVMTLSPARVDYKNSLGVETLSVELEKETIALIYAALADKKKLAELKETFPQKYIDAVRTGKRYVELKNEHGEYWIVRTRARRFGGLAKPSMFSIFDDILLRQLLIGGDWAVAYFIRRIIEQVKAGEKAPAGHHGNLKQLYPKKEDIDKLREQFKQIGDALRIFTDHTVDIEYKFPDPKVFDPQKYEKVEERILRWGGVIDVLMTGKGEGFSQGHLGARRFIAQGKRTRQTIGEMFSAFLLHPSVSGALKIPKGSKAQVSWDEQNLKDPKQVLDELESGWDRGLIDNQTFIERVGLNFEQVKARKEEDAKSKDFWVPTFEPSQGLLQEDPGGRPSDGKPTPAPSKRPKPSRSEKADEQQES